MEPNSPKRRKLDHAHGGPTFENVASSPMGASGSSPFVLETDELLKEVKLDYSKAFPGLDQTLRQLKEAIDGLEQYGPVPVCAPAPAPTPTPTQYQHSIEGRPLTDIAVQDRRSIRRLGKDEPHSHSLPRSEARQELLIQGLVRYAHPRQRCRVLYVADNGQVAVQLRR